MKKKLTAQRAVTSFWKKWINRFSSMTVAATAAYTGCAYADAPTIGKIAETITGSFVGVAKLVTAGAYVAGVGFALTAILKFKAHKDNPTQIPIGTPIALLFVSAALLFLPNLFGIAGQSVFGTTSGFGGVYGVTGLG